jgi:hypothetical protein
MAETKHGTKKRNCRCSSCRTAKNRYKANRNRLIAYGRWSSYRDPEAVRAHVAGLMARGLSKYAIAGLAGVSDACVADLMAGGHVRGLLAISADCLLAVTFDLDAIPGRASVDAAGTRRRVQALIALGYSLSDQAAQLGRSVNNYYRVPRRLRVSAETARAVRDLYDRLSETAAPPSSGATMARSMAARNDWPPPAGWDDDLIDLPDADLEAELSRRVALMEAEELRRCNHAHRRQSERSPLVVAASREYDRRRHRAAELRKRQEKEEAA